MKYQNILLNNTDGIITLTINREESMNALNKEVFNELDYFFSTDAPSQNLKGIIITGKGEKAFVAGADIKEFLNFKGEDAAQLAARGQAVFEMIERFPIPVIAAVNGFALGGGCELAMACHFRIASERARFGQPEVNLGIIPGYGGTQRLPQLIGRGRALEYLLTGDMINAQDAYRMGLANHVVPHGESVKKATEIIQKIATKAPIAIAGVIECVDIAYERTVDGFAYEAKKFGETANTEDFKTGTVAFIERRKADFKGR
ncbi:MAG TPA: enoyl-CoA hydratase [Phaeodactylibacter sp.]|nr:enoyl-CoA hydratase [Phaeodactylibacter sp.]